ncbi:MAG: hypothetical protein FWD13_12430, partial [Treponema sp.]|nr:hypothetical protein [Treponema sp.]
FLTDISICQQIHTYNKKDDIYPPCVHARQAAGAQGGEPSFAAPRRRRSSATINLSVISK